EATGRPGSLVARQVHCSPKVALLAEEGGAARWEKPHRSPLHAAYVKEEGACTVSPSHYCSSWLPGAHYSQGVVACPEPLLAGSRMLRCSMRGIPGSAACPRESLMPAGVVLARG
ncbi:hypothetical protein Dimus_026749, partial [Dionaea muscipula]